MRPPEGILSELTDKVVEGVEQGLKPLQQKGLLTVGLKIKHDHLPFYCKWVLVVSIAGYSSSI